MTFSPKTVIAIYALSPLVLQINRLSCVLAVTFLGMPVFLAGL